MEDDNGLELSLGLSFGGLSGKSKGKTGSSADIRTEEGDRGIKLVDDFKNFLNPGTHQKQDSSSGSQRSDSVKPKENFFNDLSKANNDGDASVDLNGKGFFEDEKRAEPSNNKRRMFFDELNQYKKHEREGHFADINDKTRLSHISLTTEDGSTAENEDVAESDVEGSTSRMVLHHDNSSKRSIGISGSSDAQKDARGIPESKNLDLSGQKRFNGSSENGYKLGNISYGSHFPGQPVNMMNVPFPLPMKEGHSAAAPSASAHLLPGVMQGMVSANSEGQGTQPVYPGNLPMMFGYSPVQIPLLDKDNSWGIVSQPQPFHPFAGRGPPNSAPVQHDGRATDRIKADRKQHVGEEGSSTHAEEDGKGSSSNLRVKETPTDRSTADGSSLEFSAIKPGILADVKFGGSGSCPNLPWVSTMSPNGRTISGVTYKYNANQIRIVCACHGTHMSPEEFVRHASEDPSNNPENGTGLATLPNPAGPAQS